MRWFSIPLIAAAGLSIFVPTANPQDKPLQDDYIRKLLIGKWVQQIKPEKGLTKSIVWIFKKDNTCACQAKIVLETMQTIEANTAGTWKLTKGKIETTITESVGPGPKVGEIETARVISIDETTLITRSAAENGKLRDLEWKRAKD